MGRRQRPARAQAGIWGKSREEALHPNYERDSIGNYPDGGRTYKLHLPPNVPAKDFWSIVASLGDWEANGRKPLASKDQKPVRGDYATFSRMAEITGIATHMTAMDLMQLVSLVLNDPSMTKRTNSLKEVETLIRLAKIDLAEGQAFDPKGLIGVQRKAIEEGVADARREARTACERRMVDMNGWKRSHRAGTPLSTTTQPWGFMA